MDKPIDSTELKNKTNITRTHIILDIYKCDDITLSKADIIKEKALKILSEFNLEAKVETFYQFEPYGVTATVFTPGLQFTLHTWPEMKSGAIDLYCFSGRKLAMDVIEKLKTMFQSAEYEMKVRTR